LLTDFEKITDVSSANWEISCSECKTLIPFILGFSLIFIAIISAHNMNI
jgi:hypothetical protein